MLSRVILLVLFFWPVSAWAFSDVSSEYLYVDAVGEVVKKGWMEGCGEDMFCPEQFVREEEGIALLKRVLSKRSDWELIEPRGGRWLTVAHFARFLSLSQRWPIRGDGPWYERPIQHMEVEHLTLPTFVRPDDLVNRGEMAELLVRLSSQQKALWYSGYDMVHRRFVPNYPGPVTQIPWKLNLEVLGQMRLEGSDFAIEQKLPSPSWRYRVYQISYLSNGVKVSGVMHIPIDNRQQNNSQQQNSTPPSPPYDIDLSSTKGGKRPILILGHGYYPEDQYRVGGGMRREQDYFVRQGFVTIHPDYRGYGESDDNPENRRMYDGAMGYTMDVVNLVKAFRKYQDPTSKVQSKFQEAKSQKPIANSSPPKIYYLGHSMGGAVGLNIGVLFPDMFEGTAVYAPSGGWGWDNFDRWWSGIDWQDQSLPQWGSPQENPWAWHQISAKHFLGRLQVPLQIFHGDRDGEKIWGVPVAWSDDLVRLLGHFKKDHTYHRIKGAGHVFYGKDWEGMVTGVTRLWNKGLTD